MLTVVTPAASRKLTTVATLENEIGLTDPMEAAVRLPGIIDRASAMIVDFCKRPFALETYEETFRPGLDSTLMLSRTPARVSAVTVDGVALTSADWELDAEAGFLTRFGGGCWGKLVSVTYTAGYTLPGQPAVSGVEPLPGYVEQACLTLAASLYFGSARDPLIRSESTEGVGATTYQVGGFGSSLPPDVEGLLSRHRQVLFG